MLRRLGQAIWSQSRDIRVVNYPGVMVYEIYTNKGKLYIGHDKTTDKVERLDARSYEISSFSKSKEDKGQKVLVSDFE